jgi:hypothetical protein
MDHFQEYRLHGDSRAFASPELLGFLTSTKYADYPGYPRCVNKQSAEAFCLGMTLLSMATLETHMMRCFKADNLLDSRKTLSVNSRISLPGNVSNTGFASLSNALRTVESIPVPSSSQLGGSKFSYADSINHDYLNTLLSKVKERYSNTFSEMLASFLHFDPESRIKADRLFNEYLTTVQKEIEIYDRSWIQLIEPEQPFVRQEASEDGSKKPFAMKP